jgi:hypothetical protein
MVLISMGFVSLASNEFILTRPGASHGLLLLSQGARRLVVVRVLHMLRAGGTIMPQARFLKVIADFDLMLRTCPAFESVPRDGGGSVRCNTDRMAQTHGFGRACSPSTGH